MTRRARRVAVSAAIGLCVGVCVATVASAGGGRDIKNAPYLKLNKTVQSRMKEGALSLGFSGEFYKLNLVKGDRVSIRLKSSLPDTVAPCQQLFPPGIDDSSIKFTEGTY